MLHLSQKRLRMHQYVLSAACVRETFNVYVNHARDIQAKVFVSVPLLYIFVSTLFHLPEHFSSSPWYLSKYVMPLDCKWRLHVMIREEFTAEVLFRPNTAFNRFIAIKTQSQHIQFLAAMHVEHRLFRLPFDVIQSTFCFLASCMQSHGYRASFRAACGWWWQQTKNIPRVLASHQSTSQAVEPRHHQWYEMRKSYLEDTFVWHTKRSELKDTRWYEKYGDAAVKLFSFAHV